MRVYTEWLSGNAAWEMQVCNLHIRFPPSTKTNYVIYQRILFHKGQHSSERFYHRIKPTYQP
jgi:hypothetical protein